MSADRIPLHETRSNLERIFPAEVAFEIASPAMWTIPGSREEEQAVLKAVPRRRAEFRAGRASARAALSRLGVRTPEPILMANDRKPMWPAGYIGSISHCQDFCIAAVAPASALYGLGIDVEPRKPLPNDVQDLILIASDYIDSALITALGELVCSRLIFSAKESIYKCMNPVLRLELDFHDVQVTVRPKSPRLPLFGSFRAMPMKGVPFSLNALKRLRGRYVVTETHLVTSLSWPASLA